MHDKGFPYINNKDPPTKYGDVPRTVVVDRFRRSMHDVSAQLQQDQGKGKGS